MKLDEAVTALFLNPTSMYIETNTGKKMSVGIMSGDILVYGNDIDISSSFGPKAFTMAERTSNDWRLFSELDEIELPDFIENTIAKFCSDRDKVRDLVKGIVKFVKGK